MTQAPPLDAPLGELLKHRQKLILMASLMLCMFVSALDNAIVSTATPRILADLGGFHLLSWVFTVYMLSSTVVVPIVGKLSDMFGRKLFLIGGVIVFVAASVGVGAAPSMGFLIGARALQGAGGGTIFSCVFATLGDLFSPAERGKYTGFFTGTFTLASLSGPTVGGLITDSVGWRWCFYINLPIGIAAVYFIWRNLPFRKKGGKLSQIDFLGAALLSGGTVSLLLSLVWAQKEYGWISVETIGLAVAALAFIIAFAFQERRHPQAIFPLMLFRNRVFVQANLIVMVSGAGIFGAIQYLPTFLQTSLGQSATNSGLVNTPQSIGLLVTSIIGGQMLSRTGKFKLQLIVGATLSVVATILLHTLDVGIPLWHIPVFMAVYGLGSGMIGPTMSVISQSAVSHEFLGVATSGRQFFMQIGNVLGAAAFGVVLSTSYNHSFNNNITDEAKATLPPAVIQSFEDPTSALDKRNFPRIEAQVRALPNGEEILQSTKAAQKEGVAVAIRNIFFGSIFAAIAVLILAITIPEIPLRRGFGAAAVRSPGAGMPTPNPAPTVSLSEPGA